GGCVPPRARRCPPPLPMRGRAACGRGVDECDGRRIHRQGVGLGVHREEIEKPPDAVPDGVSYSDLHLVPVDRGEPLSEDVIEGTAPRFRSLTWMNEDVEIWRYKRDGRETLRRIRGSHREKKCDIGGRLQII